MKQFAIAVKQNPLFGITLYPGDLYGRFTAKYRKAGKMVETPIIYRISSRVTLFGVLSGDILWANSEKWEIGVNFAGNRPLDMLNNYLKKMIVKHGNKLPKPSVVKVSHIECDTLEYREKGVIRPNGFMGVTKTTKVHETYTVVKVFTKEISHTDFVGSGILPGEKKSAIDRVFEGSPRSSALSHGRYTADSEFWDTMPNVVSNSPIRKGMKYPNAAVKAANMAETRERISDIRFSKAAK